MLPIETLMSRKASEVSELPRVVRFVDLGKKDTEIHEVIGELVIRLVAVAGNYCLTIRF